MGDNAVGEQEEHSEEEVDADGPDHRSLAHRALTDDAANDHDPDRNHQQPTKGSHGGRQRFAVGQDLKDRKPNCQD